MSKLQEIEARLSLIVPTNDVAKQAKLDIECLLAENKRLREINTLFSTALEDSMELTYTDKTDVDVTQEIFSVIERTFAEYAKMAEEALREEGNIPQREIHLAVEKMNEEE